MEEEEGTQGTVAELRGGALLMLLRSTTGCLFESSSVDGGRSWSPPVPTRLPNPNTCVAPAPVSPVCVRVCSAASPHSPLTSVHALSHPPG